MLGVPIIQSESLKSLRLISRANGHDLGSATGFLAEFNGKLHLVTNWHVVAGRDPSSGRPKRADSAIPSELLVTHNAAGRPGVWLDLVEPLYDGEGEPLWLEHPLYGRKVDVVALPLTQTQGIEAYAYDPLNPGDPILIGPTENMSIIGFPFGIAAAGAAIWVQGTIASEPEISFQDLPCFLVDSRTRPGQSGSPVLAYHRNGAFHADDAEGGMIQMTTPAKRFVGVYSGRINSESDLGFVWRADSLIEILAGKKRGALPVVGSP